MAGPALFVAALPPEAAAADAAATNSLEASAEVVAFADDVVGLSSGGGVARPCAGQLLRSASMTYL